jgi:hypothetical protein
MAGCAKTIQTNLGVIVAAELQVSFAKIRGATRIRILFLYWDSPEEENRQLEKLHSTLNVTLRESCRRVWLSIRLG